MNILLYFIKFLHLINEFFMMTYIYFFRTNKYDLYFTIYIFLIFLHWILLKNECILSYLEKKLIDKDYILGSKPYDHPFENIFPKYVLYIFIILKILNIIVVLLRNLRNIFIVIMILFILINQLVNLYIKYKKKILF